MTSPTFRAPEIPDSSLDRLRAGLPSVLPEFLRRQRWFGGKADEVQSVEISDTISLRASNFAAYLFLVRVEYAAALAQCYAVPLMIKAAPEKPAPAEPGERPRTGLAMELAGTAFSLEDALHHADFSRFLLRSIEEQATFLGACGRITASLERAARPLSGPSGLLEPSVMKVEQSNTSVNYGGRWMLKFFRHVEEGVNLDLEMGRFLTTRFPHTPPLAGAIEYQREGAPPATLAILQGFVRNQGDAWRYTLQSLEEFLDQVSRRPAPEFGDSMAARSILAPSSAEIPRWVQQIRYSHEVELLGRRTAELHRALASEAGNPNFAPEPFSSDYQRCFSESMVRSAEAALGLLQDRSGFLPPAARESAGRVLSLREPILSLFRSFANLSLTALRTRVHGDYHLGQVLYTGSDWVIIDFEGEPERPLTERRIKRSPLRDVAGMLRSFHYAAMTALGHRTQQTGCTAEISTWLSAGARQWRFWVGAIFLSSYLQTAGKACFVPQSQNELRALLEIYQLEKAVYELAYELRNRPEWVHIPLEGILDLVSAEE